MDTAMSVVHSVEPDLSSLSWFALLWLVCCVSGLTISGMLPLVPTTILPDLLMRSRTGAPSTAKVLPQKRKS